MPKYNTKTKLLHIYKVGVQLNPDGWYKYWLFGLEQGGDGRRNLAIA